MALERSPAILEAAVSAAAVRLGYSTLKDEQMKVMMAFLSGRDVFAVLPTGFCKSLCYGSLPLVFEELGEKESIILVATPLISIMRDQVMGNLAS